MMINQANVKTENVEGVDLESIENLYWVEMAMAAERLHNNEDFKKLVLEGYFKDKAINGVSMLATDYVRQNGVRGEIMESLVAISHFQDYLSTVKSMGTMPVDDEEE